MSASVLALPVRFSNIFSDSNKIIDESHLWESHFRGLKGHIYTDY